MTKPTVLLLGGGYALSKLAEQLPPQSFVLTSRSNTKVATYLKAGHLAENFELTDLSTLSAILSKYPSLDTVIDSVPPPETVTSKKNVNPITQIIECFKLSSIKRVIYLSTTGVYGVEDGSAVDEKTKTKPKTQKAKARLTVEELYRKSWLSTTALRISGIYVPGRGLGQALKRGNYQMHASGDHWSNRIHVDDLVNVIKTLLEQKIDLPILCVSDDKPTLLKEIVNYYCDKFGFNPPPPVKFEEGSEQASFTNQRVMNKLLYEKLQIALKYPSFKEGAETEFEHLDEG